MKFTAPIVILKQQARALSRKDKIPLHQALDRIASREGFKAWSLLAARADSDKPIDRFLEKLSPGDLALVAARPGQGKTLFSLKLAVETMKRGSPAAFFTLDSKQRFPGFVRSSIAEPVGHWSLQSRVLPERLESAIDSATGVETKERLCAGPIARAQRYQVFQNGLISCFLILRDSPGTLLAL